MLPESYVDRRYPQWRAQTLWSLLADCVDRFPQREFFTFESYDCTYEQAYRLALQTAKGLMALGVRPGDHVALLLHNCPAFLLLTFALAAIGAVKVPINANLGEVELRYILEHTGARLLFSERQLPEPTLDGLQNLRGTVLANCRETPPHGYRGMRWEDFLAGGDVISDAELRGVSERCQDPYALSDIMFTSGSTARPKGVMLTHDMLLRSSFATCRCRNMEEGRRIFIPIPLFNLMAYNEALLPVLHVGGTLILTNQRYEPRHCLEMIRTHRANDIVCVSSIMVDLLTKCSPRPEDFPEMRHGYWSSACPEWIWQAGKAAFGLEDVCTGYGMTECGSTTTMATVFDPPELVRTSHGRLKEAGAAGCREFGGHLLELRVCDAGGQELSPGESGELYCRGLTVTKGYYNDPEANTRAFTKDGWFRTGDLVRLDGSGYLTYLGRISDIYKINGENVSPRFVEEVIGASPQVAAVEVVGLCHPKCGEVGVAFIDAPNRDGQTGQDILAYCREHLAGFQIPKYFIFSGSEDWPRTGSGKVRKRALRELASDCLSGRFKQAQVFDTRK